MNILNPTVTHPSFWYLVIRFFRILKRYGLSSKKILSNLKLYQAILQRYGVPASFSIPAKVLSKHPKIIKEFSEEGVEFAVHGYRHIDYSRLSEEETLRHLEKAVTIFQEHDIPFLGFRFPYLRYNNKGINILGNLFEWDSSDAILSNIGDKTKFAQRNLRNYQLSLNQYNYKNSDNSISLPRFRNNILELPVSLPDDDLLIDRLGIKDEKTLSQIWSETLKTTYIRGDLLVLQLHPERIPFYKETLKTLLQIAQVSEPKIWVTSLNSIYKWWKEKQGFRIDLHKEGNDEYEIHAHCSQRASVLVKSKDFKNDNFYNDYRVIDKRNFIMKSSQRPIVGISRKCSPILISFLKNEGIAYEISPHEKNYAIYLNDFEVFNEGDEYKLLQRINNSESSLIRFWRWPDRFRSALAITGDIDALTTSDFLLRAFGR